MATNYEKRFDAIDEGTVYAHVAKVRQYGGTYVVHQPVRVIEKHVPIAGIAQLVGVRVERSDTGEQFDTHVKNITRPWADFIDLEVSREAVLEIVEGRAHQYRTIEIPVTWRATLAANHLSEDFVQDGDELYALVEYTTVRKTSRKQGHSQEERVTSVVLMEEDGTVREIKKRAEFKDLLTNEKGYERVKTIGESVFATEVDVEALTDEVIGRLRNGEATLTENRRSSGVGIADIADKVVKETLN